MLGGIHHLIQILKEYSDSKHWRPWSAVTLTRRQIWSGQWLRRSIAGGKSRVGYEAVSQHTHDVKTTSYRRRCDVTTSHRHCYDIV